VFAALFLLQEVPTKPQPLRMHLAAPTGRTAPTAKGPTWLPPSAHTNPRPAEAAAPKWKNAEHPAVTPPVGAVPVSLDDLLGPAVNDPAPAAPASAGEWSGPQGLGYNPPPLPPPGVAPPQGAHWNLVVNVPAAGGLARSFEGLDSGNAPLDAWLEEYLRTVSFPSSPNGEDYQLHWNLRLASGRPQ
jgi:hypothetical protein